MDRIIIIAVVALSLIGSRFVIQYFLTKNKTKNKGKPVNKNIVKQHIIILYTGIFGFAVFTSGGIFAVIDKEWTAVTIILIFSTSCLLMIIYQLIWKIEVTKEGIIFRNIFGIQRKYIYDVLETRRINNGYKIYNKEKKRTITRVSYYCQNFNTVEMKIGIWYIKKRKSVNIN